MSLHCRRRESSKEETKKRKIKHLRLKIILLVLMMLLVLYTVLVYFIVSAALIPSFMEKLDAFEDITVKSYAEMVHTDDIQNNQQEAKEQTEKWLEQADMKKVQLVNKDGYKLIASEFAPESSSSESRSQNDEAVSAESSDSHRWALVLHGYTGWKEEMYEFARWYSTNGYHVLVPDLRCQGESEGDFIGMGWTDHYDCLEWLDYILQEDPEAEIVLHGQSMGAATVLIMTGDQDLPDQVVAAVSDCSYTDAYSMFADKAKVWLNLPAFPLVDSARLMLLLRGGYDLNDASPINAVRKSHTKTLFIHGDQDQMVPVSDAYQLYDAASCEKQLLIIEGAGHAQAQQKDPELYYETIEAFLLS